MDEVILNKHAIIQRCLKRVEQECRGHEQELATHFTRQDAIILNIQRACQAVHDLANRVIRFKQLGIPQDGRESFSLLLDHRLITLELSESLSKMVGFRNIAVHEYQKLDIEILRSVIERHLSQLQDFAEQMITVRLSSDNA